MASGTQRPNGSQWVFYSFGGKRRTLRFLGQAMSVKARKGVEETVQRLVDFRNAGLPLPPDMIQWIESQPQRIRDQLAAAGLCERRVSFQLSQLIDLHCRMKSEEGKAESTIRNLRVSGRNLLEFLGDLPIDEIGTEEVRRFVRWLGSSANKRGGGLDEGTRSGRLRRIKEIYQTAKEMGWPGENPFRRFSSVHRKDESRDLYIRFDEFERVLAEIPQHSVRLGFLLCRVAGLRPGELPGMRWSHWEWDRRIVRVYAPKTKTTKTIPIYEELSQLADLCWDEAEEGSDICFPMMQAETQSWKDRLKRAARSAGVIYWPKPFPNLRASAEHDLAMVKPIFEFSQVLGHTPQTALKAYNRHLAAMEAAREGGALRLPNYNLSRSAKRSAEDVHSDTNRPANRGNAQIDGRSYSQAYQKMLPEGVNTIGKEPLK